MNSGRFKKLRKTVIDLVMATDMKQVGAVAGL